MSQIQPKERSIKPEFFKDVIEHLNHYGGLLKTDSWASLLAMLIHKSLGPEFYISNKFPGHTSTAGLQTTC